MTQLQQERLTIPQYKELEPAFYQTFSTLVGMEGLTEERVKELTEVARKHGLIPDDYFKVYYMTQEELIKEDLRIAKTLHQILKENGNHLLYGFGTEALKKYTNIDELAYRKAERLFFLQGRFFPYPGYLLHMDAFIPVIEMLADEEQRAKLLPLALDFKIIGCYAQTELGHGSDVQSLQTTAEYITERDCFVLNTPTVMSYKFWPGMLGKTSTHAMVMAKLILEGNPYGVMSFIIQIRDLKTFEPLKGVELGDIGPKSSIGVMENGYLKLTNYEAPKDALLSKYFRIEKEGNEAQFVIPDPSTIKFAYGSMMNLRIFLIGTSSVIASAALTIAIRYGITRRQFKSPKPHSPETQIIEYQFHQKRLFSLLSVSISIRFLFYNLKQRHTELMNYITTGENKKAGILMKDLHSLSCAGKADGTMKAWQISKQARESCGGHGFLDISGLPGLVRSSETYPVVEGEYYILLQQTGRYLIFTAQDIAQNKKLEKVGESVQYLLRSKEILASKSLKGSGLITKENLIRAFEKRSVYFIHQLVEKTEKLCPDRKHYKKISSDHLQIDIIRNSNYYIQLYTLNIFYNSLDDQNAVNPKVREAMKLYCENFALNIILEDIAGFMSCGFFDHEDIENLREIFYKQLKEIRKICLLTVDSFRFEDYQLRSALGGYDGKVYETIYKSIKNDNPMNSYDIRPLVTDMIKGKL